MSTRARAWTALALPPAVWFVFEQGLSALLHADCSRSGIGIAWGAASLAICAVSARLAWPRARADHALADPWIAHLGVAASAIFSLAIAFQTLAILLVPACLR